MNNDFIQQMPQIPSSVTASLQKPIVSDADIKRAFDACIDKIAFKGEGKYHDVMNMYKISQLYGKNCETETLVHCLLEYFKKCSKAKDGTIVDKLSKNIVNTQECIKMLSPDDNNIFIALILGYAYSVFSENNG
jgi:hypothetical protein